jgi:hypothetical protein
MLLLPPPYRVVDADLRRIDVDHPPRHRAVKHLPQRLCRFEAVAGREPHPPRSDLLGGQLANPSIAEHGRCLAEQVAELLDRHRLDVVLRQVRLDELGEGERARDPTLAPHPIELTLERVPRVLLAGESATLNALGATAARPVTVRPQRLAAAVPPCEFEDLSLLHHRWDLLLSGVDPLPPRCSTTFAPSFWPSSWPVLANVPLTVDG